MVQPRISMILEPGEPSNPESGTLSQYTTYFIPNEIIRIIRADKTNENTKLTIWKRSL